MNGQEKRKFERYTTDSECEVTFDSKVIKGKVIDYSDGICIIIKYEPTLVKGSQADIKILGTEIELKAEAVWIEHIGFHLKAGFKRLGNLKGNLNHYRIADILIGINKHKKTGILEIRSNSIKKRILISNGDNIFADSSDLDDRLGQLLIKRKKITHEQLNQAAELVSKSGERLGTGLISLGFLKQNDLVRAVKHQVEDIIVGLFNIENGTFDFKEGSLPADEPIILQISSAKLVYKGIKKINNVALIEKMCPPLNTVFNISEHPMPIFKSLTLNKSEKQILSYVDGINSFAKILSLASSHKNETRMTIIALLSIGHIQVTDEDKAPEKMPMEILFKEPDESAAEGMETIPHVDDDLQGKNDVQESPGTTGMTDNNVQKTNVELKAEIEKEVEKREKEIRSHLEKEIKANAEEEIQRREAAARDKLEAETGHRVEEEVKQKEQTIREELEAEVNARVEEEMKNREEELRARMDEEGRAKVEEEIRQREGEIRAETEAEVRRNVEKVKAKSEDAVREGVEDVRMKVEEEIRQIEKEIWEKAEEEIQQREADARVRVEEEVLVRVEEEIKKRERELIDQAKGKTMIQAQEEIGRREEEIRAAAEENVKKRVDEVKANVEREISERVRHIQENLEEEVRQSEEALRKKLEEDVRDRVNAEVVDKVENEVIKRAEEVRMKVAEEVRQREEEIRIKMEQEVRERVDDANAQVEEAVGRRIKEVKHEMEEEVRRREEEIGRRVEENVRVRVEEELMAKIDREVKEKVEAVKEKLNDIILYGSRNTVETHDDDHGDHDHTTFAEESAVSTEFTHITQETAPSGADGNIFMVDTNTGVKKEHIYVSENVNEDKMRIDPIQGDSNSIYSKVNRLLQKTMSYISAGFIFIVIIGSIYYTYSNKSSVSSTVSEEKNRLPSFNQQVLNKFLNE